MPRVRGGRFPATSTGFAYPNVGGVRGGRFGATNNGRLFPPVAATASPSFELIESQALGADAASITFSSIPQTYAHLTIQFAGRTAESATSSELSVIFNNDTSAYDSQRLYASGATVFATEILGASRLIADIPGDTAPASVAGGLSMLIPDYARTAWQKCAISSTPVKRANSSGNVFTYENVVFWRMTSAITEIKLYNASLFNLKSGTIASLYGIKG